MNSEPNNKELDLWDTLIYRLNGTCSSIRQVVEEEDRSDLEDNSAFLSHLDDQIFECTCCGWWYDQPANEFSGEWVCDSCCPEKEDDKE